MKHLIIIFFAVILAVSVNGQGLTEYLDDCSDILTICDPTTIDEEIITDPFVIIINTETVTATPVEPDYTFVDPNDWDGDGVDNETEQIYADTDTDGDGVPDYLDTDSDNDGIPDGEDWCRTESGMTDIGVTPTGCLPTAEDLDGDGIPNDEEPEGDIDNDGLSNENDPDSDGDGFPDGGTNADLCPWMQGIGSDDGCPDDTTAEDLDGDGVLNELEENCLNGVVGGLTAATSPDSDGDGLGDLLDHCPCDYSTSPDGCERSVFWVHGFYGNLTSWAPVSNEVGQTWKTDSWTEHCIDYSKYQDGNLNDASDKIEAAIQGLADEQNYHEDNIVIAHSLGGMALRNMEQIKDLNNDRNLYEGLITFGSAHNGQGAANNGQDNPEIIEDFLSYTCSSLGKPLILDQTLNGDDNIGSIEAWAAYKVLDVVSNELCTNGTDFLTDMLIEFSSQGVAQDATTEYMSTLPPMHATHNVILWGEEEGLTEEEDSDLTARLFGSLLNPPADVALYGANDNIDNKGIAAFSDRFDKYLERTNELEDDLTLWDNLWETQDYELVELYQEGLEWFNQYHLRWMQIIGAADIILGCDCTSWSQFAPSNTISHSGGSCEELGLESEHDGGGGVDCVTTIEFSTVLKANDGFVTAESASYAPGVNYPRRVMAGSNHLQMRNDKNTQEAMEWIFDGGCGIENSFFVTEKR